MVLALLVVVLVFGCFVVCCFDLFTCEFLHGFGVIDLLSCYLLFSIACLLFGFTRDSMICSL